MTTVNPPAVYAGLRLPTRQEWRAMTQRPAVLITLIVAAVWVVTLFVGAIVFLTYNGLGTEALTMAIVGPVVGVLVTVSNRMRTLEQTVERSPNIQAPPST